MFLVILVCSLIFGELKEDLLQRSLSNGIIFNVQLCLGGLQNPKYGGPHDARVGKVIGDQTLVRFPENKQGAHIITVSKLDIG